MAVARTGLQVFITHDVRAAASGEAALGSARGAGDHLFVAMGTGIGAAVVIGGKPYAGTHATAGRDGPHDHRPRGPRVRLRSAVDTSRRTRRPAACAAGTRTPRAVM